MGTESTYYYACWVEEWAVVVYSGVYVELLLIDSLDLVCVFVPAIITLGWRNPITCFLFGGDQIVLVCCFLLSTSRKLCLLCSNFYFPSVVALLLPKVGLAPHTRRCRALAPRIPPQPRRCTTRQSHCSRWDRARHCILLKVSCSGPF